MLDELRNVYKKIFMYSRLKDYDAVEREANEALYMLTQVDMVKCMALIEKDWD